MCFYLVKRDLLLGSTSVRLHFITQSKQKRVHCTSINMIFNLRLAIIFSFINRLCKISSNFRVMRYIYFIALCICLFSNAGVTKCSWHEKSSKHLAFHNANKKSLQSISRLQRELTLHARRSKDRWYIALFGHVCLSDVNFNSCQNFLNNEKWGLKADMKSYILAPSFCILYLLLWMNVMLYFICMGFAEL